MNCAYCGAHKPAGRNSQCVSNCAEKAEKAHMERVEKLLAQIAGGETRSGEWNLKPAKRWYQFWK